MSESVIIYPTSANPPTWGHADIMMRAATKFDKLYWVAGINHRKNFDFTDEERVQMMQAYVDYYDLKNVTVTSYEGTIIRYANSVNASFLLRGLRNTTDFQAELDMAAANRGIEKDIETICMFTKPHFATISSTTVRELATFGEKIDQYVLPSIAPIISNKLERKHQELINSANRPK
ncbi:MAG: pantetheine-phosphate adenylyltransferase [Thermoproteota archaeon]|jgi:pantetheine-phosphate adenylyltransferase